MAVNLYVQLRDFQKRVIIPLEEQKIRVNIQKEPDKTDPDQLLLITQITDPTIGKPTDFLLLS